MSTLGLVLFALAVLAVCDVPITGLVAVSLPVEVGTTVTFEAGVSNGTNVTYVWSFSDGAIAIGAVVEHQFATLENCSATVNATNSVSNATTQVAASFFNVSSSFVSIPNRTAQCYDSSSILLPTSFVTEAGIELGSVIMGRDCGGFLSSVVAINVLRNSSTMIVGTPASLLDTFEYADIDTMITVGAPPAPGENAARERSGWELTFMLTKSVSWPEIVLYKNDEDGSEVTAAPSWNYGVGIRIILTTSPPRQQLTIIGTTGASVETKITLNGIGVTEDFQFYGETFPSIELPFFPYPILTPSAYAKVGVTLATGGSVDASFSGGFQGTVEVGAGHNSNGFYPVAKASLQKLFEGPTVSLTPCTISADLFLEVTIAVEIDFVLRTNVTLKPHAKLSLTNPPMNATECPCVPGGPPQQEIALQVGPEITASIGVPLLGSLEAKLVDWLVTPYYKCLDAPIACKGVNCTSPYAPNGCPKACALFGCNQQTKTCTSCPAGMWGPLCTDKCPPNCYLDWNRNSICNATTGECGLCENFAFYGKKCEKPCTQANCGPPWTGPPAQCRQSGYCLNSCKPGYWGEWCDMQCWGHCNGGLCNRTTGSWIPVLGCAWGWCESTNCTTRWPC